MRADQGEDLLAIHWLDTVAVGSDEAPSAPSSPGRGEIAARPPARARPGCGRSRPPERPAPRPRSRARNPRRVNRPWATTPSWRSPSMYAPPGVSGSISVAQPPDRRGEQPAAELAARRAHRRVADRAHRATGDALDQLQRDVAGESVHHDDVGDPVGDLGALDVADEVQPRAALAARAARGRRRARASPSPAPRRWRAARRAARRCPSPPARTPSPCARTGRGARGGR